MAAAALPVRTLKTKRLAGILGGTPLSRLYLLRHAKAAWAAPGMRDFDRPLDATGEADARATGTAMQRQGFTPDLTLCSGARRARETLSGIAEGADTGRVLFLDCLYSEDAAGYLEAIRKHSGQVEALLVIGHNPMLEDLALALAATAPQSGPLSAGFPTSGLAVVDFHEPLSQAAPGKGTLIAFLTAFER